MALIDQYNLISDPAFQPRCIAAALQTAGTVIAEPIGTANHVKRTQYASFVTASPFNAATAVAAACAADGLTNDASTDAQILARVAAVWDQLAGTN